MLNFKNSFYFLNFVHVNGAHTCEHRYSWCPETCDPHGASTPGTFKPFCMDTENGARLSCKSGRCS